MTTTTTTHHSTTESLPVIVRVPAGRRKRADFERQLQRKPQYLFSFRFEGNLTRLSEDEYQRLKSLVRRARIDTTKLFQCWSGV
jgi:hypothetical protein